MGSTSRNQKPGGKVLHDSLQRSVSGNIYLPGRVVKHFFAAKAVVGGSPATRAERQRKKMSPPEVFS